jgi:hypothetical protein
MRKLKIYLVWGALIIAGVFVLHSCYKQEKPALQTINSPPVLIVEKLANPQVYNPVDIILFQGSYVAAELLKNRLAIFDDLSFSNLRHFDPKSIGKEFIGPHFLAISPWNSLLISDGWGASITEIKDLKGNGWEEFVGVGKRFNAPHGICVDDEGWIYVGDSLNSRLVRFKDMQGKSWQDFADPQKKISYIRQLVCEKGTVWISNSYEDRPGLNKGIGSNVLKLTNFESGLVEEVISIKDSNITGIMPFDDKVLVGLWGNYQSLAVIDQKSKSFNIIKESKFGFGVPYGVFNDPKRNLKLVTYFGSFEDKNNIGGIAVVKTN